MKNVSSVKLARRTNRSSLLVPGVGLARRNHR